MKTLMVCSSRTGNTEKVCRAAAEVLEQCDIYPVAEAPSAQGYDLVCVGYWVDKGMPDAAARAYIEGIANAQVALLGTLGAWPDSDHAKECQAKAAAMLEGRGNTLLGSFICMGRVDPKVVEMMQKKIPQVHVMDEARKARLAEGAKHPDENDLENARAFMRGVCAKAQGKA